MGAALVVGLVGLWRWAGRPVGGRDGVAEPKVGAGLGETRARVRPVIRDDDGEPRTPAAVSAPSPVGADAPEASLADGASERATDTLAGAEPIEQDPRTVTPLYRFWDDTGGPPALDEQLDFALVEASDGQPHDPWTAWVDLAAVRRMQPAHSLLMPLPTSGRYRVTSRKGLYLPLEIWVPDLERPTVDIVLRRAPR